MGRPVVAKDVVRLVGEIVAIVVSEDRATGADAAELVMVDYDPLPVVVDRRRGAEGRDAPLPGRRIERRRPDAASRRTRGGSLRRLRRDRLRHVGQPADGACPLEPRSTAAMFEDGKLTVWLSTQTPHGDRDAFAGMLGLDPTQVRVDRTRRRRRLRSKVLALAG